MQMLSLSSCAQIKPVTGGEKDTIAPKLDTLNSTQNFQTNFQKQEIKLLFNEFVQLKDIGTQIVISPPLEKPFKVKLNRYRNVVFEFDEAEELKKDVTYTINFGESIRDFTEGNEVDYNFVFSTGDFIDSLEVRGAVRDAFTNEPKKDVLFMLYESLADTVPLTQRPFYFGRTNEQGQVIIKNVKADTFKVFVLEDADINYKYNQESEGIGFLDSLIVVTDSFDTKINIQFSQPRTTLKLQKKTQDLFGKIQLNFNRKPFDAELTYDDIGQRYWQETDIDTINIWYDTKIGDDWNLYFKQDTIIDTTFVEKLARDEFINTTKLTTLKNGARSNRASPIKPKETIQLLFNHPIDSINIDKIVMLEDTLLKVVQPKISIDSVNLRQVNVAYAYKETLPYKLVIADGAFKDWYGLSNDSIVNNYKVLEAKELGNILLTLDSLDATQNYVYKLIDKSDKVIDEGVLKQKTSFQKDYIGLAPGKYFLRIIKDENGNGRWDPANYYEKKQAERIFDAPIEELRANWDVEAKVLYKETIL